MKARAWPRPARVLRLSCSFSPFRHFITIVTIIMTATKHLHDSLPSAQAQERTRIRTYAHTIMYTRSFSFARCTTSPFPRPPALFRHVQPRTTLSHSFPLMTSESSSYLLSFNIIPPFYHGRLRHSLFFQPSLFVAVVLSFFSFPAPQPRVKALENHEHKDPWHSLIERCFTS